jgi:hypothetical protein
MPRLTATSEDITLSLDCTAAFESLPRVGHKHRMLNVTYPCLIHCDGGLIADDIEDGVQLCVRQIEPQHKGSTHNAPCARTAAGHRAWS